jgi:hypothetical protein
LSKLGGIELELVLSSKHERIMRNDYTVTFKNLVLQLPSTRQRIHFVRCPVGPSILQRHCGHQLSGPSARALRWRGPTTPQ